MARKIPFIVFAALAGWSLALSLVFLVLEMSDMALNFMQLTALLSLGCIALYQLFYKRVGQKASSEKQNYH